MSQLLYRAAAMTAGLAIALSGAASARAAAPEAPASYNLDQVYAPPADRIAGAAGSVVWWRSIPAGDPANRPEAAIAKRVIYRSTSISGAANVESASVYVPAGAPPAGGWKVIAWNHVTTGGADLCAPSRATPTLPGTTTPNPEFERLTRSDVVVSKLLTRGYVVVRPDYEGIGTPGEHPYLIGKSLARSTVDAVRATRELVGSASTEWAVSGQSEGAIASLWTSSLAPKLAPELTLKATLAATPPIDVKNFVFELGAATGVGNLTPMAALMYNGARLANGYIGGWHPYGVLSSAGYDEFLDLETRCLAQLTDDVGSIGDLSVSQFFGPSASFVKAELYRELDRNDPLNFTLGTEPIRVYAGGLDLIAPQSYITKMVDAQLLKHAKITYEKYPWATHVTITAESQAATDMADWLQARLG